MHFWSCSQNFLDNISAPFDSLSLFTYKTENNFTSNKQRSVKEICFWRPFFTYFLPCIKKCKNNIKKSERIFAYSHPFQITRKSVARIYIQVSMLEVHQRFYFHRVIFATYIGQRALRNFRNHYARIPKEYFF